MDDLAVNLESIDMISFYTHFIELGYTTWQAAKSVSDSDLEVMGMPHDSRRKLKNLIAVDASLAKSPIKSDPDSRSSKRSMQENGDTQPSSPDKVPRRKYKRHPKPDVNAPERPLTAYVRFSKDKRKEYQERRLSFSELAKQIGIDWQQLSPSLKNKYLGDAASDWTSFRKALDDYHASDQYADYVQYLRDFATENPDSNVKLPQADLPLSPIQRNSNPWDAEGSSHSNEEGRSVSIGNAQANHELDMSHYQYDFGQQPNYANQTSFNQVPMTHHIPMSSPQQLHGQQETFFSGFTDPWQQQPRLHLNTVTPSSRFSRESVSLQQTLQRAQEGSVRAFHHPHQTSSDSTPNSDRSANTITSSSSGMMSGVPQGTMPGSFSTEGHIYSPQVQQAHGQSLGYHYHETQTTPQDTQFLQQPFLDQNPLDHDKWQSRFGAELDPSDGQFDGNPFDLGHDWAAFTSGHDFIPTKRDTTH